METAADFGFYGLWTAKDQGAAHSPWTTPVALPTSPHSRCGGLKKTHAHGAMDGMCHTVTK
jgi:hypothetical protein